MRKKKIPREPGGSRSDYVTQFRTKNFTPHDVFVTFHNWVVVVTVTGNLDFKKSLRRPDVSSEAAVNLLARRDNH